MPEFSLFGKYKMPEESTEYGQEGFLTEFAEDNQVFEYGSNREVEIEPEGRKLRLSYNGLLAKSGAQDVYAAVSYGDNENWKNVKYYPMGKTEQNTFEALLPIKKNTNLNVAFKDGADHWDNNSGNNYSFTEF